MFKHVMTFGKRTECFSASFSRSSNVSAVPAAFVNCLPSFEGLSGSLMISSRQDSRVKPTSAFLSSGKLCGSGLPRDTSRKSSGLVINDSKPAIASLSNRSSSLPVEDSPPATERPDSPPSMAALAPICISQRRVTRWWSDQNRLECSCILDSVLRYKCARRSTPQRSHRRQTA